MTFFCAWLNRGIGMSNQTVRVRKLRTFVLSAQAAPSYIIMKFTVNMKRRVDGLAVLIVDSRQCNSGCCCLLVDVIFTYLLRPTWTACLRKNHYQLTDDDASNAFPFPRPDNVRPKAFHPRPSEQ
jgi:hypothetical protein